MRKWFAMQVAVIRITGLNAWLWCSLHTSAVCRAIEWCQRVYYCHHNARVLADMEHRLSCVLCECTDRMSKPYYTVEAMRSEIQDFLTKNYQEGYDEGFSDGKNDRSAA